MAMTLEELQILITTETAGLRRELEKVKKELIGLDRSVKTTVDNIRNAFNKVKGTLAALGVGATIRAATKDAMEFEASIQQIQRLMGGSAGAFRAWAYENAAAFGMARSEIVKYGAVYANLISNFATDTAQITQYTQDLLHASAVVASYTGRTMEDVMERIRSGLLGNTEAIEDLGINVNVAMIESTEAFRRFANGRSWQQLDFQTQQLIRYFSILEQAARKYGSEIADNVAGRHAAFIAQLKELRVAFGEVILPIYNAILPALTQLAKVLTDIMRNVAAFMQALFGYTPQIPKQTQAISQQTNTIADLGNAYEEAGKKAQLTVASFDEVHQLNTGDSEAQSPIAGAGDAFGGIGEGMAALSEKAKEWAEKLRGILDWIKFGLEAISLRMLTAALNAGKFSEAIKALNNNLSKLKEFLKNTSIGKWFTEALLPWLKESPLLKLFSSIRDGITKAAQTVKTKAGEIAKALDLNKILAAFRESVIVQKVMSIFSTIQSKIKEFTAFLKDNAIVRFFAEIGSKIAGFAQQVGGKLAEIGAFIARLVAPFRVVWEWIVKTFEWVLKLWEVLTKIPVLGPLLQLAGRFAGILGWILLIIDAAKAAIWVFQNWEKIPEILAQKWDQFKQWMIDLWENISAWLAEKWDGIKTAAVEKWREMGTSISNWWINVKTNTVNTWNDITGRLGERWETIKTAAAEKWQGIANVVTDWWGKIHAKTTEVWESTTGWLSEKWDGLKTTATTKWQEMNTSISDWWNRIKTNSVETWTGITGWLSEKWNGIKTAASDKWNAIKSTISSVTETIRTLVGSSWSNIKSKVEGIWNGISSMAKSTWTGVKETIRGAINGIIDLINRFIRAFNKIRIEVPRVNIPMVGPMGGFSIGMPRIPEIPMLARGGIVEQPTLALIGEAGKEAVVPLEHDNVLAESIGQSVYKAMVTALRLTQASGAQPGGEEQREVVLRIDGTTFARAVMPYIIREGQRRGLNLRPQTGV